MLKHLGEDVGKTVTTLSVDYLQAASVDEVKDAFSLFSGGPGGTPLTKLKLSSARFPLEHIVSAITCLQDIVSLDMSITEAMLPDWTGRFTGTE